MPEPVDAKKAPKKTLSNATQFGTKSFKELNVASWLIGNLEAVGITKPTLIQE